MAELGLAAAWALAALLAVSGAAKVVRGARTRASFAALGVPAPRLAAGSVPAAELAVAATLVAAPRAGAVAALALLGAFTAFVALRLRAGVTAACACFGAGAGEPTSPRTLARNGVLLAAAGVAVTAGEPGVPSLPAAVAVTAAGVTAVTALALTRLRAHTGALLAVDRLLPAPAPARPHPPAEEPRS